jgi:hypothetical protein
LAKRKREKQINSQNLELKNLTAQKLNSRRLNIELNDKRIKMETEYRRLFSELQDKTKFLDQQRNECKNLLLTTRNLFNENLNWHNQLIKKSLQENTDSNAVPVDDVKVKKIWSDSYDFETGEEFFEPQNSSFGQSSSYLSNNLFQENKKSELFCIDSFGHHVNGANSFIKESLFQKEMFIDIANDNDRVGPISNLQEYKLCKKRVTFNFKYIGQ